MKPAISNQHGRVSLTFIFIILLIAIVVGIGLPHRIRHETSPKNTCINNLRLIDSAIQQWGLDNNKSNADTPTWEDLKKYLGRQGEIPKCPLGGTYTLGRLIDKPTCSYPGHEIP